MIICYCCEKVGHRMSNYPNYQGRPLTKEEEDMIVIEYKNFHGPWLKVFKNKKNFNKEKQNFGLAPH